MTERQGIEYLSRDSGRVPCSRYGTDSESCAPVAYAVSVILVGEGAAEAVNEETLDYVMGLVVNDHDDPEYLIRNYGAEYGYNADELLPKS